MNLIGVVPINGHPQTTETKVHLSDDDDDIVMSVGSVTEETCFNYVSVVSRVRSTSEKPEDCFSPSTFKDTPLIRKRTFPEKKLGEKTR